LLHQKLAAAVGSISLLPQAAAMAMMMMMMGSTSSYICQLPPQKGKREQKVKVKCMPSQQ